MGVLLVDLDVRYSTSVLLERALHDLGLSTNSPDSDFTFHTTRNNLLAVVGSSNGGDTVVVGIVDGVEESTRLWQEGSDLTVVPSREDSFTISLEENAVALEAWNLNSQQLLSGLGVPHSDVVKTAGSEELRESSWESDVVDSLVVASISQLWGDVIGVAPVDGCLVGTTEEMSGVGSKRNGCNGSHNLGLSLNVHVVRVNLGEGTIT